MYGRKSANTCILKQSLDSMTLRFNYSNGTYFQSIRFLTFEMTRLHKKHWNGFPAPTSEGSLGTRSDTCSPSALLDRKEVWDGAYSVCAGTLVPIPESWKSECGRKREHAMLVSPPSFVLSSGDDSEFSILSRTSLCLCQLASPRRSTSL